MQVTPPTSKSPVLAIILPCFNEEEILQDSIKKLLHYFNTLVADEEIASNSFLCFVDDGSKDNTWNIIEEHTSNNKIKGVKLSRNYGHQNALLAGLSAAKEHADVFITMDSDLQDDIQTIKAMMHSYKAGNEIVYGVRDSRESDTFFKKKSAQYFYRLQNKIGIEIIQNHADFRLISKNILIQLEKFNEVNLYLRAIFPIIGFKHDIVYYKRQKRTAGESKYPFFKMLSFAWDGISSFSVFPLRLITALGSIIFVVSMGMVLYILGVKLFTNDAIPGWASTIIPIYFIGGIQLFSLGVIGEYVGKIYKETKRRPKYIIEEEIV